MLFLIRSIFYKPVPSEQRSSCASIGRVCKSCSVNPVHLQVLVLLDDTSEICVVMALPDAKPGEPREWLCVIPVFDAFPSRPSLLARASVEY